MNVSWFTPYFYLKISGCVQKKNWGSWTERKKAVFIELRGEKSTTPEVYLDTKHAVAAFKILMPAPLKMTRSYTLLLGRKTMINCAV